LVNVHGNGKEANLNKKSLKKPSKRRNFDMYIDAYLIGSMSITKIDSTRKKIISIFFSLFGAVSDGLLYVLKFSKIDKTVVLKKTSGCWMIPVFLVYPYLQPGIPWVIATCFAAAACPLPPHH